MRNKFVKQLFFIDRQESNHKKKDIRYYGHSLCKICYLCWNLITSMQKGIFSIWGYLRLPSSGSEGNNFGTNVTPQEKKFKIWNQL